MRQPRNLISWAKTCIGDDLSRSCIDGFARCTDARRSETRVLRFSFKIPNVGLSLGWFAKHEGSCDVGLISIHTATSVHQNHITFLKPLRSAAAVRESRVLPKADENS